MSLWLFWNWCLDEDISTRRLLLMLLFIAAFIWSMSQTFSFEVTNNVRIEFNNNKIIIIIITWVFIIVTIVIMTVHLVHLTADPQTNPLRCQSTCSLLSSTSTIAIYLFIIRNKSWHSYYCPTEGRRLRARELLMLFSMLAGGPLPWYNFVKGKVEQALTVLGTGQVAHLRD